MQLSLLGIVQYAPLQSTLSGSPLCCVCILHCALCTLRRAYARFSPRNWLTDKSIVRPIQILMQTSHSDWKTSSQAWDRVRSGPQPSHRGVRSVCRVSFRLENKLASLGQGVIRVPNPLTEESEVCQSVIPTGKQARKLGFSNLLAFESQSEWQPVVALYFGLTIGISRGNN